MSDMAYHEIVKVEADIQTTPILEDLFTRLSDVVGVTFNGNRVSLRWNKRATVVGVDLILLGVEDGTEETPSIDESIEPEPVIEMTSDAEPQPDE